MKTIIRKILLGIGLTVLLLFGILILGGSYYIMHEKAASNGSIPTIPKGGG